MGLFIQKLGRCLYFQHLSSLYTTLPPEFRKMSFNTYLMHTEDYAKWQLGFEVDL